jgi:hypothetical protein
VLVGYGLITPDWKPLITLLEDVLTRLLGDLAPQCPVEASITVRYRAARGEHALVRLATVGGGAEFVEAQIERLEGPIVDAVASGEPVLSSDVWNDPRWPGLTRATKNDYGTGGDQRCARVRGIAVLPGEWGDGGVVVMSCCLERPADETTLARMRHYEQLAAGGLTVVYAAMTEGPAHVSNLLRASAVIEQAKGAIIAAAGCDADNAWQRLRTASQHLNVKVRDLAFALVEHLGHAPAEQLHDQPRYAPVHVDAATTAKLWSVLADQVRSP